MKEAGKKKQIAHLMIDLETLGKHKDSIILSCAIKSFVLPEQQGGVDVDVEIERHISAASSLLYHRMSDYETEEWWNSKKRTEARNRMLEGQLNAVSLEEFAHEVYPLLNMLAKQYDIYLWGRGVGSFDLPILSSSLQAVIGDNYCQPWEFWQAVDVRTFYRIAKWSGMPEDEKATPHSAMDDCNKQISEVLSAWNWMLRGGHDESDSVTDNDDNTQLA